MAEIVAVLKNRLKSRARLSAGVRTRVVLEDNGQ